jgi:hypothetical protein
MNTVKKSTYIIKYWETNQDREQGNSETYLILDNKMTAIAHAEKLFYKNDFVCVEVHDDNDTYLTLEY